MQTNKIDRIESLRQILEEQQCRPVTYKEAWEVGEGLMRFYEVLAQEAGGNGQEV